MHPPRHPVVPSCVWTRLSTSEGKPAQGPAEHVSGPFLKGMCCTLVTFLHTLFREMMVGNKREKGRKRKKGTRLVLLEIQYFFFPFK